MPDHPLHGTPARLASVALLQALAQLTPDLEARQIMQLGVDIAQHATSNRIAYLHLLNEDQQTIELGVWSHDTLAKCTAVYDQIGRAHV